MNTPRRFRGALLTTATTALGGALVVGVLDASWQQPTSRPQFEVASIKPSPYEGEGPIGTRVSGKQLISQHQPLAELILYAYDIKEFQLSGGPSWVYSNNLYGSDVYEVLAKSGGESVPTLQQFRLMLQSLLAERFKLTLHRESKEFSAYALVIGPKGSKLQESTQDSTKPTAVWKSGDVESDYEANAVAMTSLINVLRFVTEKPVLDKTGLNGVYKFHLHYADPESLISDSTAPSIFSAVQDQLGLRLESVKEPFETLVIDSVQRPSEN